jgi:hypothetical protein
MGGEGGWGVETPCRYVTSTDVCFPGGRALMFKHFLESVTERCSKGALLVRSTGGVAQCSTQPVCAEEKM